MTIDSREQRAIIIAAICRLDRKGDRWLVPSQTAGDKKYVVDPEAGKCNCADCEAGFVCKHIRAVRIVIRRERGADGSITETKSIEFTEQKMYRQDWAAYNEAQTTEKHRLQVLLADLCRSVPQLPHPKVGPRRAPTQDVVFSMAFKVYCTLSTRRFMCDLADACDKGHIAQVIHYNSICRAFESKELTPILRDLIVRSSLPLRAVESDFAPDSTGFSTSRFIRWYDEKYGAERSEHDWVKVHIMTGVRTNVVTAVEVQGRDANDSPIMPTLLKTTTANFTVKEVSADKGYSSVENIAEIVAAGAVPYIAFKSNATGAAGGHWEKAFHFYQFKREEFLQHYHKRSNVESTFSMVKAKFRDHVRAKTDTAMANEVLCKLLCHNICVLIQSQCELGIEPIFWPEEKPVANPDVLTMVRQGDPAL